MLTYIATIDPELLAGIFFKLTRPNGGSVEFDVTDVLPTGTYFCNILNENFLFNLQVSFQIVEQYTGIYPSCYAGTL